MAETIAALNDAFRTSMSGGTVTLSRSVADLPAPDKAAIVTMVREFNQFKRSNDPHGEHDMGVVQHNGKKLLWKIDYYDPSMESGSEDPADPAKTHRVLTIMFAEDY